MTDFFVDQIFGGNLLFAAPIALLAGLVSFASPCVLPLVPGYLAYSAGAVQSRMRLVLGALLFIAGFSILFISYGSLFGQLGSQINSNAKLLNQMLGALTIVFGSIFLFPDRFYRSLKLVTKKRTGLVSAPFLGFMFGLGWTPCIGPTLGAVQTLAFSEASAVRGALLSAFYCLGLGGPFLLFALYLDKSQAVRTFLLRQGRRLSVVGGVLLIVIGLLQLTGLWETLMIDLRSSITEFVPVL